MPRDRERATPTRTRDPSRLSAWLLLGVGLVLLVACVVQSAAALEIFLAISGTRAASDRLAHSTEALTPDIYYLRPTPWLAEAQDLFLLAWSKAHLVALRAPSEMSAVVLESAMRDAVQTVTGAPGYSAGWLMLADLRRVAGAPASDVAELLKISMLTAPFEPYRSTSRLIVAFAVYSSLDEEGRDLLASQIRIAWRHVPEELARLAKARDQVDRLFIIRLALAADPPSLAEFEKLLGRLR